MEQLVGGGRIRAKRRKVGQPIKRLHEEFTSGSRSLHSFLITSLSNYVVSLSHYYL